MAPYKKALLQMLETITPLGLAELLNVHNAHVYISRKPGNDVTPTLREALKPHMREMGMLKPKGPYPYFKVRRDDPTRAAEQILDNLGHEYARDLAGQLLVLLDD